jgi:ABC-type multidrug transport system fused ATPase/permease subunit
LNLRRDAFNAVVARDMSFYDEYPSGKIVSRVTSDTEDFATVVTLALNLLSQILLFFLIAVVLFVISTPLALLAFSIMPFIVLIARVLSPGFPTTQRSAFAGTCECQRRKWSRIAVAKNFRQEQNMYDEFKKVNETYQVTVRSACLPRSFPYLYWLLTSGTVIVSSAD